MKNKNLILWIIIIFLTLSFSLSFIKSSSKDKRKPVKTALLNPKYKASLNSFILYDSSNAIEFSNNGAFWTINNPTNPDNKLPADNQKVQNLIEKLTQVNNMYKISDSLSTKNDFGLQDSTSFHLIYYTNSDTNAYTDLIFGNHDFTQQYRYFMTGNNSSVYEINTDLDSYLTSNLSVWNEGLIISKNLIKNPDIQKIQISNFIENTSKTLIAGTDAFTEYSSKLLELRQGGIPEENPQEDILLEIKINFGNLDEVILQIYSSIHEGEYLLKEKYNLYNSTEFLYITKISGWTYSKLQ